MMYTVKKLVIHYCITYVHITLLYTVSLVYNKVMHTIFTWFVVHIRIVAQCVTIQVQMTLFSWLILIVAHPWIVPNVQIFRSKWWVSYSFQNMPNNTFCHNNNYHKSIMIVSIFNSQFRVLTYIKCSYSLVCMIQTSVVLVHIVFMLLF